MAMTTWRKELDSILTPQTTSDLVSCTLTKSELDKEFDSDFGGSNGQPFTAWTSTTVYFPIVYDGSEWVGDAPRNPTKKALGNPLEHQGGS